MRQDQFLTILSRDEAEEKFHAHINLAPREAEEVPTSSALGRVLALDVVAGIDVPAFHRSNVDGFAVVASDTYTADEEKSVRLSLTGEQIAAGDKPTQEVTAGRTTPIATGGVIPRGASAIVMVEFTDVREDSVEIYRPAGPGENISYAGSDIMQGETVLRAGQILSSRETGTLAALGIASVSCVRQPRVAVLSTGNEIISPGEEFSEGMIYDSNARIVADTVLENGGVPVALGIVPDVEEQIEAAFREGLKHDMVVLSGGTSKGGGDLNYSILERMGDPGIIVHGVALKPGKPICIAVIGKTPVIILPGFPTSAIVTFRDLVQPVIRSWAGLPPKSTKVVRATQALRYHSTRGRMEYLMTNLVKSGDSYKAYPWSKGSGAVTTFSQADGFIRIPANQEILSEGEEVEAELIGESVTVPDITSIGSHCVGLEYLLSEVRRVGFTAKIINVGSQGGLEAARRGESDLAGIHLLDEETGQYNAPFVADDEALVLVRGYRRRQGILTRGGEPNELRALIRDRARFVMVNRNRGSGTRILTDRLLASEAEAFGLDLNELTASIRGYEIEARSHNAVATSIAMNKADWGIGIENVACDYELDFTFLDDEMFDFVIPKAKLATPAIRKFLEILNLDETRQQLERKGFLTVRK
ncbi:MAG: molybdopterin biosynthesis protein [Planctomycetota bacterium]|nr:molybdopterin biosynthesis protein [Planctomycetota bacterium]